MMKRPFAVIGFTVFFTIAFLFDKETGVTAAALAVFAVALVVALFSKKIKESKFMLLCPASGAVACVMLIVLHTFVFIPAAVYAGGEYRLKAQIKDEVSVKYGKYYFDATSVEIDGEEVNADLRLVFSIPPDLKPYDYVEGDFAFYQPGATDKDYLNSYRAKGLLLGAYPVSENYRITETPDSEKPFMFRLINLRNIIKRALYDVYPDENGALAVGMILGDKSEIASETYNSFRSAGIVHLICVSGLHLTLWASLILAILRSIGLKEKPACILAAVGVVLFMALTGFSYSVIRSGIMMLVYLASRFVSREQDSINSLGFSVVVIALVSPYAMASASLQLSVLATLGILCVNEYVFPDMQLLYGRINNKILRAAVKFVGNALLVTMSATLFIQPVMLGLSGGFSFASIVSNLIVTPFASGAMIMSALGALSGVFLPPELNIFGFIGKIFLQYIIKASGFIASKDILNLTVDKTASDAILCIVFFFLSAMLLLAFIYKPKYPAMLVAVCAVFFVSVIAFDVIQKNETRIRVVDTGNGVSVLVTQNGNGLLIGCGGTSYTGETEIINAQAAAGGFDCLVLPSADKASSAYALDVIKECNPKNIYVNKLPENAEYIVDKDALNSFDGVYSSDGIEMRFHEVDGEAAAFVETKDVSLLVLAYPATDLSTLPQNFREADLLVCLSDYPADSAECSFDFTVICANNQKGVAAQNELISRGVNAVATGGNGDVIIKANKGELEFDRE